MFCPNCGTNNEEGAAFCANCGTSLTAAQPEAPVQVETPVQPQVQAPVQPVQPEVQPQAPVQPEMQPQMQPGMQPQQAMYGQAPVYGQPQQPQQPKKEFKLPFQITKKLIIISASVAAAIIAIIIFFCVGNSVTDPKKTAVNYVKAVEECNWNKAYENIKLPKSEFLTKDAFIAAHADATGEKVTSIKATKGYSTAGNLKNNKAFTVVYSTPSSAANTKNLVLTVDNSHYMLFFKKYKVASDGLVVKDCKVNAPKGATLKINGVDVASSYLSKDSDKSSYDVYVIPYLFYGYNQVVVSTNLTEDYESEFYAWEDEYTTTISSYYLKYTDDAIDKLEEQAVSDMEKILKNAQTNATFNSISDLVMESAKSDVQSDYSSLASKFNPSSKTISNFSAKDMTGSISSTSYSVNSTDGCPTLKVTLKFSYTYSYMYSSSTKATDASKTSSSSSITYKYSDGKWKISDIYVSMSL